MQAKRTIVLVDDDAAVRDALSGFLEASGYSVRVFPSAEAFLENTEDTTECVMLLDQRMSGMSGLELQEELTGRGISLAIIFISGHGDVQMSVKAVKAGAINFLEKPFTNEELLESLAEAFSLVDKKTAQRKLIAGLVKKYASLSDREKEVMQHLVAGMTNKEIANQLDLSDRTIEIHRSKVINKLEAKSIPDLVRKYEKCRKAGLK